MIYTIKNTYTNEVYTGNIHGLLDLLKIAGSTFYSWVAGKSKSCRGFELISTQKSYIIKTTENYDL